MSFFLLLWLAALPSPAAEPTTEDLTLLARHLEGYPAQYEAFKSSALPFIPDDLKERFETRPRAMDTLYQALAKLEECSEVEALPLLPVSEYYQALEHMDAMGPGCERAAVYERLAAYHREHANDAIAASVSSQRGYCVQGCNIPSVGGGGGGSGGAGYALGEAMGQLLFRGISSLFAPRPHREVEPPAARTPQAAPSPTVAEAPRPPRPPPPPKPKPLITGLDVWLEPDDALEGELVNLIAAFSFSGEDPKKGGIMLTLTVDQDKKVLFPDNRTRYTKGTDLDGRLVVPMTVQAPSLLAQTRERVANAFDDLADEKTEEEEIAPQSPPSDDMLTEIGSAAAASGQPMDLRYTAKITITAVPGEIRPAPGVALEKTVELRVGRCPHGLVASRGVDPMNGSPGSIAQARPPKIERDRRCQEIEDVVEPMCRGDRQCRDKEYLARDYDFRYCPHRSEPDGASAHGGSPTGSPGRAMPPVQVNCVSGGRNLRSTGTLSDSMPRRKLTLDEKAARKAAKLDRIRFREIIHRIKKYSNLPADADLRFDLETGEVLHPLEDAVIGNLTE